MCSPNQRSPDQTLELRDANIKQKNELQNINCVAL